MRRNKWNVLQNQIRHRADAGSTMVEVIVGFVILVMVLMECMVHLLGVSGKLVAKSKDMQEDQRILNEEMYKKDAAFDKVNDVTITLTLDRIKTQSENTAYEVTIPLNADLTRYRSDRAELTVFRLIQKKQP